MGRLFCLECKIESGIFEDAIIVYCGKSLCQKHFSGYFPEVRPDGVAIVDAFGPGVTGDISHAVRVRDLAQLKNVARTFGKPIVRAKPWQGYGFPEVGYFVLDGDTSYFCWEEGARA